MSYSFIDYVIPQQHKKVTGRLLSKIKRKDPRDINKCSPETMCSFAKLCECETMIKRKIIRLIQKFHARLAGNDSGASDL